MQTLRGPGQEQEEQEVVGGGEEPCREEGCWVTEALKSGRRSVAWLIRLVSWKLGLRDRVGKVGEGGPPQGGQADVGFPGPVADLGQCDQNSGRLHFPQ